MAGILYFSRAGNFGGCMEYPTTRGIFNNNHLLCLQRQSLPTDPIGTTNVTFSGVNAGSEIRVYLPDGTEVAGVESCDPDHVLTWSVYAGGSPNNTVRITILLRGFRIQKFQYAVTLGAQSLPIFQIVDLGYFNPT